MKKQMKPGDLFNKFQAKKKHEKKRKSYSEADMGSMKGYDPNLGVGKAGMKNIGKPLQTSAPFKMPVAKPIKPTARMKKHKKNWIAGAIKHPGALHRELGVKKGQKIPAKTLAKAAGKKGIEGKRARLAETLKGFRHKKHRKEHSSEAIKGMREFVSEEAKEKKHRKHKKGMNCKMCGK